MRLRVLDAAIIAASAALVAASAAWAYAPGSGEARAVVKGRGGEWIYPLDEDREVRVEGPLGDTLIRIEAGAARIEDSPCPNKTCVATGAIARPGQWAACLPNGVLLRVEGGGAADGGVDASAY
jgi:hypothetical protein